MSVLVYIAGPMTGLPEFNYPAFYEAERQLFRRGLEALNPANSDLGNTTGVPRTWVWYMRAALVMVARADGVCLLPGWQASKGAQLEVHVAEALGLDIRPLDEWLKEKVL